MQFLRSLFFNIFLYVGIIFIFLIALPALFLPAIFTLLFGVISGFLTSVFVIISNKTQIKSLQNKNRILTEELNDLRNVAIDEGIYESDDGDY